MTTEQQEKLYELEETTIVSYNFDLFKNQIIFELKNEWTNCEHSGKQYKVIFKNVSAFSFIYESGELDDLEIVEWDPAEYRLEFTSISFLNKINTSFSGDGKEWLSQYKPCYNVAIEMELKTLLINATDIIVDDEVFKIDGQ